IGQSLVMGQRAPGGECERVAYRRAGARGAASTNAATGEQDILDAAQVAVEVAQQPLDDGDERLVPQQARVHGLGAPVERVELAERGLGALRGIRDRGPRGWAGWWVRRAPVRGAGGEERDLVREVAVNRRAPDAGVLRDRADRRPCRADPCVQRDRALGDPPSCLLLELGSPL